MLPDCLPQCDRVQALIPLPEPGRTPWYNRSSGRSETVLQRNPRGPAERLLLVASVATQSWWRLYGTRPWARHVSSGRDTFLLPPCSPGERRPFANGRCPLHHFLSLSERECVYERENLIKRVDGNLSHKTPRSQTGSLRVEGNEKGTYN